mgnify:CR=1 FL=1
MTWSCMVCKAVRPDEKISVFSKDTSAQYQFPPGTMRVNIRYCNDKPECQAGAKQHSLVVKDLEQ